MQVLNDVVHQSQMKHISVAEFWICNKVVQVKNISTHYIPTAEMPANLLTKALPCQQVVDPCKWMGLPSPTEMSH